MIFVLIVFGAKTPDKMLVKLYWKSRLLGVKPRRKGLNGSQSKAGKNGEVKNGGGVRLGCKVLNEKLIRSAAHLNQKFEAELDPDLN